MPNGYFFFCSPTTLTVSFSIHVFFVVLFWFCNRAARYVMSVMRWKLASCNQSCCSGAVSALTVFFNSLHPFSRCSFWQQTSCRRRTSVLSSRQRVATSLHCRRHSLVSLRLHIYARTLRYCGLEMELIIRHPHFGRMQCSWYSIVALWRYKARAAKVSENSWEYSSSRQSHLPIFFLVFLAAVHYRRHWHMWLIRWRITGKHIQVSMSSCGLSACAFDVRLWTFAVMSACLCRAAAIKICLVRRDSLCHAAVVVVIARHGQQNPRFRAFQTGPNCFCLCLCVCLCVCLYACLWYRTIQIQTPGLAHT